MNDRSWENQSQSYQNEWDQDLNRYGRSDDYRTHDDDIRFRSAGYGNAYGRSRMDQDEYRNSNRGYNRDYESNNRYNEQRLGSAYNDRWGMESDRYRNQMQSMSGNRDFESWNDRNRGYGSNEYGSMYGSDYGRMRNTSGGYGDRSDRNYGGGYTGAGSYSSNRGYGDSGYDRTGGGRDRDWWDRTKDEVSSWFGDEEADRRRHMDRVSGPHRGKGPKDYQRSEDRIREDVCDRLSDDDRIDASNVQVQIQNNEVILTGTVRSKEEKRRAEDLVESISGVRNVENRLRVSHDDDNSMLDGSTRTGTGRDSSGSERDWNR